MKKIVKVGVLILCTATFAVAQQAVPAPNGMHPKVYNFTTFTTQEKRITDELLSLTPEQYRSNPDFGKLPENSPCTDCIEQIDKRTENVRHYAKDGTNGKKFYIMQGYSPINYKDANGNLKAINEHLQPDVATPNVFVAPNQPFPVKIDAGNKFTSIVNGNYEMKYNRNLKLIHKDQSGNATILSTADWTNYTAGSDGIQVKNIFPNVDMQIIMGEARTKTNFIVNAAFPVSGGWLMIEDDMEIPAGFSSSVHGTINDEGFIEGEIDFANAEGIHYILHKGIVYDNAAQSNSLFYKLNGNIFELYLSVGWLNDPARQYPVTIDPTVQTSGTVPIGSIVGHRDECTWTSFCSNALSVNTPANVTVTDVYFKYDYQTNSGCGMNRGSNRIAYAACLSPAAPGFYWYCNTPFGGTCTAGALPGISIFTHISACVPAPQCAPYAMVFTLQRFECNADLNNCDAVCIVAATAWTMTIEGETVAEPAAPVSSEGNSICNGYCTQLTATPTWGVPPYTYLWNPGALTGNPVTVCPPANTTTTYTCTITDACGNTAANTRAITTLPTTLAPPASFSYFLNPAAGGPCPVDVTVCTLLPSNYGAGGPEAWDWNFIGGTVTSGGAQSGSSAGANYGGAGISASCGGTGAFYNVQYTTSGTYTIGVQIVKGAQCTFVTYSIVINCALPIDLLSFKAKCNSGRIQTDWAVATQINNDYFTVERSADGVQWEIIGIVDGAGNSSQTLYYGFIDGEPLPGTSYYRLKQTDFDGKFEYFDPIAVSCSGLSNISIYPNPSKGRFTIDGAEENSDVLVTNVLGEKIMTAKITAENKEIDLSTHPEGIYFIHVISKSETLTQKIILGF